jgi:undecaprenyl diphosphate synthase
MAFIKKNQENGVHQISDGNGEQTPQKLVDEQFKHIAFIMDGNGRWATKRGMPREYGHREGVLAFKKVGIYCCDIGFEAVTVYAFSTENWKRPKREVNAIMKLLDDYLEELKRDHLLYRNRFRFIGDLSVLTPELQAKIKEVEQLNADKKAVLNVALNYGGRADIVQAVNRAIAEGKIELTEQDIADRLYTAGQPDPDLVVRTGGEMRISNFLLWQTSYSEYYSDPCYWPDFDESRLDLALAEYEKRTRKFGGNAPAPEKGDQSC